MDIWGIGRDMRRFDPNTIGEDAAKELTRITVSGTYSPTLEEATKQKNGVQSSTIRINQTFIIEPWDRPNDDDDDVMDNVEDYRLFYATSELTQHRSISKKLNVFLKVPNGIL
ncbi:MAG: hypothetical protein U5L09_19770 [Bacteroidales bacterium]|nr:hypothetical protein [Bacteroidales bacterium]